jgi:hypothetical protein
VASIAVPFSFVAFAVHRFCIVMHHRNSLFKKKRWTAMCIIGFWIVELILSLPFIGEYDECCSIKVWMGFYAFITVVIIPMSIIGALDIQMFMPVRNSTRRIQPQHINAGVGGINNHKVKITRRDISLLKHMIFTFLVFIVGWTPVLLLSLIDSITPGHIF